jgi:hypothetical protein
VFIERGDGLLVTVFEDVESAAVEAVYGIAVLGDDDVNEDQIGVGAQHRG